MVWAFLLVGCAPGWDARTLRTEERSSLPLPVETPQGTVLKEIEVQQLTPELIIRMQPTPVKPEIREPETAPRLVHSDYRLGPEDVISVVVWGHPALGGELNPAFSSEIQVTKDGTIYYPPTGELKVSGLTVAEVRAALTEGVRRIFEGIRLDVLVSEFRSQRVFLTGRVGKPGTYFITDRPLTLLDLIEQAGGLLPDADRTNINLTRKGQIQRLDLSGFFEVGKLGQNVQLFDGDILHVNDDAANRVFLMGEIANGSFPLTRSATSLGDVLGTRGITGGADPKHIFVIRRADQPEIFHLSAKEPDALLLLDRFLLKPRDIVYVDAHPSVRWQRFIGSLPAAPAVLGVQPELVDDGRIGP